MPDAAVLHHFPLSGYVLPESLIARYPVSPADSCKLMIIETNLEVKHEIFRNLGNSLEAGDTIIYNNSTVQARRMFLKRERDGKSHECLFLNALTQDNKIWEVMIYRARKIKEGELLYSEKNPDFRFKYMKFEGKRAIFSEISLNTATFNKLGEMPIPPYFNRRAEEKDITDYQNFFAETEKITSSASPTASLHFTKSLRENLLQKEIRFFPVSLGIGYGTFAPIREENIRKKKLHAEYFEMPLETARALQNPTGRIICLGTTALRVTETVCRASNGTYSGNLRGFTDIFLYPPDRIQSAQGLITNFHLPASSLFLLVSCIFGIDFLRKSYETAIREQYRFFSYGDAMFLKW